MIRNPTIIPCSDQISSCRFNRKARFDYISMGWI